jgi:hypothetical protein
LRHREDLVVDEPAGRKKSGARRRAKVCGEYRVSGYYPAFSGAYPA